MKLNEILQKMINGDISPFQQLKRGLCLQYRQPEMGNPRHRLLCYRVDNAPSTMEFVTVRRELRGLVDGEIELGEPREFGGGRRGRIFSWQAQGMTQATLPLEINDERPYWNA